MIECVNVTKLDNLYNDGATNSDQHEVYQKNCSNFSKPLLNDIMGVLLKNQLPKDPSVKHLDSIAPDNFDHASFLSAEFFASIFTYVKYCVLAYLKELNLSGPANVAIDNKIEQALDLVKSHLMFAVREEVEVLKEQIKELIEKNSLLEAENKFLRNEAAPETLAKLIVQQPVVPQASTILPPSQPQQLLQQKLTLQQQLQQGNNKQFVKQQQPPKLLD